MKDGSQGTTFEVDHTGLKYLFGPIILDSDLARKLMKDGCVSHIATCQGRVNQNHSEVLLHTHQDMYHQEWKVINTGEGVEMGIMLH